MHVVGDDGNFYDLFTIYSENKNHFKNCMDISLSIFKQGISNRFFITDENKYNVKELNWIEEFIKEGIYYTEEYVRYKDVEIYDILKIKNPIPDIDMMKKIVKKNFKKNDSMIEAKQYAGMMQKKRETVHQLCTSF